MNLGADLDRIAYDPRWAPLRGWHDDYCGLDRTPDYRPALQQVRAELVGLLEVCRSSALTGRCLQLGLGHGGASHAAFRVLFDHVTSVDWDGSCFRGLPCDPEHDRFIIGDTHAAVVRAQSEASAYDLLFIDAGHRFEDVWRDWLDYAPMVRAGGIIAFHDAAKRPGYENEIEVWRFLREIDLGRRDAVTMIGEEVGIAYLVRDAFAG